MCCKRGTHRLRCVSFLLKSLSIAFTRINPTNQRMPLPRKSNTSPLHSRFPPPISWFTPGKRSFTQAVSRYTLPRGTPKPTVMFPIRYFGYFFIFFGVIQLPCCLLIIFCAFFICFWHFFIIFSIIYRPVRNFFRIVYILTFLLILCYIESRYPQSKLAFTGCKHWKRRCILGKRECTYAKRDCIPEKRGCSHAKRRCKQ